MVAAAVEDSARTSIQPSPGSSLHNTSTRGSHSVLQALKSGALGNGTNNAEGTEAEWAFRGSFLPHQHHSTSSRVVKGEASGQCNRRAHDQQQSFPDPVAPLL